MQPEVLRDSFVTTKLVPLDMLYETQGELKSLSKTSYLKFRAQLLENGFTAPFIVWEHKGQLKVLDGHQRLRTLKMMADEGVGMPKLFPVNIVRADNEKRARKILLGLVSQYGKLSDESVSDFMIESEISLDWLFDNIDLPYNCGLIVDVKPPNEDQENKPSDALKARNGDVFMLGPHELCVMSDDDLRTVDAILKFYKELTGNDPKLMP